MEIPPENVLRHMSAEDRAKLGKAGMTADEANDAYEAGKEKELQSDIANLFRLRGIEFIAPPFNRKSQLPEGWPDFTFSYLGFACALEAKTGKAKARPGQMRRMVSMAQRPNCWICRVVRSLDDVRDFLSYVSDLHRQLEKTIRS